MATKEENQDKTAAPGSDAASGSLEVGAADEQAAVSFDNTTPTQLGTAKYVQAAFLTVGVLGAYVAGKVLATFWNLLASWPSAVRAVPGLLSYAEDERTNFTMPLGALIGIVGVVYAVRKESVRQWADEVATELYKVHWPDREVVTNGTIVVLVASAFATVYVGLLDRLWAFITNLVYGA
jgi:preprotein translocase subunit SecE